MLLLIVLFIAAVVGITAAILLDEYTWQDGLTFIFALIGALGLTGLIIALCTLINIDRHFEARVNEYEALSAMVESYDGQDYGNMQALTEQVVQMNTIIANHKAYCGNKWTGIWYSEDIAKLEPIKFGKKNVLKE